MPTSLSVIASLSTFLPVTLHLFSCYPHTVHFQNVFLFLLVYWYSLPTSHLPSFSAHSFFSCPPATFSDLTNIKNKLKNSALGAGSWLLSDSYQLVVTDASNHVEDTSTLVTSISLRLVNYRLWIWNNHKSAYKQKNPICWLKRFRASKESDTFINFI